MTTKTLTIEKPDYLIDNWDQFKDSAMKLLWNRFGLNESHVNHRIRNILTAQQLRNLSVFLVGSDWSRQVEKIGDIRIIEE
jgi:hypothetical protein